MFFKRGIKMGKRLFCLFFVFTLVLSFFIPSTAFAEQTKIKVGFPYFKSVCEVDENGNYKGLSYDYLMEINKYTDWDYEFVFGNFDEIYQMMSEGKIDILGGILYDEKILEFANFPAVSSGLTYNTLMSKETNSKFDSTDISTVNNSIIGVNSKDPKRINDLKIYLKSNALNAEIKYFENDNSLNNALDSGAVDLILSYDLVDSSQYNLVVKFNPQPFYYIVNKSRPDIMRTLNTALKKVNDDYPLLYTDLYNKYFGKDVNFNIAFTGDEVNYIKSKKAVNVVFCSDIKPLHYIDKNTGRFSGVCADIIDKISEKSGLKINVIPVNDIEEASHIIKTGKADMMISTSRDIDIPITELIFSVDYLPSDVVMVKKKNKEISNDEIKKIAVPREYFYNDYESKNEYIYYDNVLDCFNAVIDGEADAAYLNSYVAEYWIEEFNPKDLIIIRNVSLKSNLCFAYPIPTNTRLISIIDKAIKGISNEEVQTILYENINNAQHNITIRYLVNKNPMFFICLCIAVTAFLLSVIFIFYMYRQHEMLRQSIRKQALYEKSIKDALNSAQSANKAKTTFLSHISHEIRTPLNGIMGMINFALDVENMPEQAINYINKAKLSSKHLLNILNDILDMSRIESGKVMLDKTIIDNEKFIDDIKVIIGQEATVKGINFKINYNTEQTRYIIGDEMRLKQIILNLLSNSIKFTKPGGLVTLLIQELGNDAQSVYMRYIIQDNGIGMSEEFQKRLFTPFEQENAVKLKDSGSGLGLAITKNLVDMMGGHIDLKSTKGRGTKAMVSVRFDIASNEDIEQIIEKSESKKTIDKCYDFSGHRVLIAEDNELNMEIETIILEKVNLEVHKAWNGEEAIRMFKQSEENFYEVIFMDIMMPKVDGLEAAKKIRNLNRTDSATVPIFALTANAFSEDISRSLASGMDAHISKPFEPVEVYSILDRYFSKK